MEFYIQGGGGGGGGGGGDGGGGAGVVSNMWMIKLAKQPTSSMNQPSTSVPPRPSRPPIMSEINESELLPIMSQIHKQMTMMRHEQVIFHGPRRSIMSHINEPEPLPHILSHRNKSEPQPPIMSHVNEPEPLPHIISHINKLEP